MLREFLFIGGPAAGEFRKVDEQATSYRWPRRERISLLSESSMRGPTIPDWVLYLRCTVELEDGTLEDVFIERDMALRMQNEAQREQPHGPGEDGGRCA